MVTAPRTVGTCTGRPFFCAALSSSSVIAASEAPKSTVPAVNCGSDDDLQGRMHSGATVRARPALSFSEHDRGARFCCRSGRDFNLRAKARRQARFVVFDNRRRPLLIWVALALCAAAIAAGCGGGGGTATSGACMSSVAREGQRLVPGLLHGDLRGRQCVNATDAWLAGVKGAGAGILLPARPRPGITFCERRVLGEDREPSDTPTIPATERAGRTACRGYPSKYSGNSYGCGRIFTRSDCSRRNSMYVAIRSSVKTPPRVRNAWSASSASSASSSVVGTVGMSASCSG